MSSRNKVIPVLGLLIQAIRITFTSRVRKTVFSNHSYLRETTLDDDMLFEHASDSVRSLTVAVCLNLLRGLHRVVPRMW